MASTIKKRPVSPRQKMINLMYIVLLAMLALNVSSDVLKGFVLIGNSLRRTTDNAIKENKVLYADFAAAYKSSPAQAKPWYDKAMQVKQLADSLYNMAGNLRIAIARECDGKNGDPDNLQNKEDLTAAEHIMLAPANGKGEKLYKTLVAFRKLTLELMTDPRQKAIIASNLSTDVPQNEDNVGKNWQQYMFEQMPSIAAVTMLTKLQNDVRRAENEVVHNLYANINLKDLRINKITAIVQPESTVLHPGDVFRSKIFMAAIDTTQAPEIYVNGKRVSTDGNYSFTVGQQPGDYTLKGYALMRNLDGDVVRRDFLQHYSVETKFTTNVPNYTPTGCTIAADLMNVLYAGFDNPISVTAAGSNQNVSLSMTGGTLTQKGPGKYTARPAAVGQPVTFTVTAPVNGKMTNMGSFTFQVRKLPDPSAYIALGGDRFKGGRLSKASAIGAGGIGAAIDDGLLNIPFTVLGFETVFVDRMGNFRPEASAGASFTEAQRNLMRELRRGQRFYISKVRAKGPDGVVRQLSGALEVIIN